MNKKIQILLRIWIICMIMVGCTPSTEDGSISLIGDIAFTKSQLILKNGDRFVWKNVKVTINDEYIFETEYVPRGNISIPFQNFINYRGEGYQHPILQPTQVKVTVLQTERGEPRELIW